MNSINSKGFIMVILLISLFLTNCKTKPDPFKWLTGTWELHRAAGGSRFEIWTQKDKGMLSGKGLRIEGKDTFLLEKIELVNRNDIYYYIPTVPDQNNAKPIEFKMTKMEDSVFTFENLQHDFPQRIIYRFKPADKSSDLNPKDSLLVRVESLDGQGIDYGFSRS